MRRSVPYLTLPSLLLWAALAGIAPGCTGKDESTEHQPEPIARVHVFVARVDTLTETLTAYGTVIPAPGSVQSFAVAFECVVQQVLVNSGQRVEQGAVLARVAPSPAVRIEAAQARTLLTSQETVTSDTRQRFEMGLATRDDLALQEQALANATSESQKYEEWIQRSSVISPASGLVREVLVSEGTVVPAGTPLVSVALRNRFEIRLGVEPEDVDLLHVGQPVLLTAVDRSGRAPLGGRIRSVGQQVSLDTRLVEVLVAPPDHTDGLLLNQFVRAEIEVRGASGLIVPRSALLPHEDGFLSFTVHNGVARQHQVELGVETESLVQLRGPSIAAGDSVVVLGNYELSDDMRVQVVDGPEGGKP